MKNKNLAFLRKYIDIGRMITLSLTAVFASIFLIAVAYLTKFILDGVSTGYMLPFVIIDVILLGLYAILNFGQNYGTTEESTKLTKHLVEDVHAHVMSCSYDYVTKRHSVEMLKLVANDSEIAISTYVRLFPTISSMVAKFVLGLVFMFIISYEITLVALAVGIVVTALTLLMRAPIKELHKKVQDKVGISNAYMQEGIKNIETVKALNMNDFIKEGVSKRLDDVRNTVLKKTKFIASMSSSLFFMLEMAFLAVLIYGGILITNGRLNISDYVALIGVIEVVKTPFLSAPSLATNIFTMLSSTERVRAVLDVESEQYIDGDIDGIELQDVSYSYGDKEIVRGVNFSVTKGETIALAGYSGVGKSTIIKLMLGILKPTAGVVYVLSNGERIPLGKHMLSVGYVPQNICLFGGTVRDNITHGNNVSAVQIDDIMMRMHIYDDIMDMGGLDYVLGENGEGLSVGQRQRLAIVRALLMPSDIIVMDEPFSALDRDTAIDIYDNIITMGKAVVVASHDNYVKAGATRVIDVEEWK